ncbi:hypothetical protein [Acinetobacter rathckeae]|uniref:hypothetical protein n=1 Tax=Acinetobacter rathckeae TaxID=2605272 RepID=UPI0018A2E24C|nr:hypothetical protein [Acinetobacter rathckeae]MBF7687100.1 hypothetical protein [Acinetobacter rathckeae]MBF7696604.1 hypothetical protein [Acinetobacter rathckeae]
MIGYHNTCTQELKEIIKGHGDYAGIFVTLNASHMQSSDYGDHCYRVTFDSICELSDIEAYLETNTDFLIKHPKFLADCEEEAQDDNSYFENQKLRALIAIELGFDAIEENDGILVVNGTVEYIGTKDSEAVEIEIEENY